VKVPDGMDIKINENDPRVPAILASWRARPQPGRCQFAGRARRAAADRAHAAEQARIAAEDAKLGANAKDRKAAVGNWLKGMKDRNEISGEEYEAVKIYATDAARHRAGEDHGEGRRHRARHHAHTAARTARQGPRHPHLG
jgi:hypothetical protein